MPTRSDILRFLQTARTLIVGGLTLLLISISIEIPAFAANDQASIDSLLSQADAVRTADPTRFSSLIATVEQQSAQMTQQQASYLSYLKGWRLAYDGNYEAAIPMLRSIADGTATTDVELQFRASSTVTNVFVLATRYREAFTQLGKLLELLPKVPPGPALDQGLSVIAYLYNQVGEYDLALAYAERLIAETTSPRSTCSGAQLKYEALFKSTRLQSVGPDLQPGIDICVGQQEFTYANVIRTYLVRQYIDQGRFDDALAELNAHYDEVKNAQYMRLLSEFEALLAQVYRDTGNTPLVKQHAENAVEHSVPNQYTEPLIAAYRLLYLVAKEQGDATAALAYYEKYAASDKGYLDDVSARQIAYERIKQEALATKAEIATLNQENQLLQLQRENNRLYIVVLILLMASIIFLAYRTKRSQLHFKRLSEVDGLTGISNRPHFLQQAEAALDTSRKTHLEVCVVLCDLDHFKAINDRYGHATGDRVLKEVVAEFRRHLRANDIFGRVGGEEFGVLLPGCSLEAARERCEQLRAALGRLSITLDQHEIRASASFGIETTASCNYDLRQLLANADAALYQAKDAGRDRVSAYDPSMANTFTSMTTGRVRATRDRFQQDFAVQPSK